MDKNNFDLNTKRVVVHDLIGQSRIGPDYFLMLSLSTLIATLGILANNISVVIGGMLLAPLLSPILALGLGFVTTNKDSLFRSVKNIAGSMIVVLFLSGATAFFSGKHVEALPMVLSASPSLLFVYIAILSGIGATFSWARPNLSANLPGIAVTVALVPPLCVTGIGLSILNHDIIVASFQLFFINLLGIAASSGIVFSLMGYHQMRLAEKAEITEEEIEKKADSHVPLLSQVPPENREAQTQNPQN